MAIVYDRTKTVVRRHVAPGGAVPLHPKAVGFAGHYDFDIDVLAAYRPTGKGRVERQVLIVRDHVLSGRSFSPIEEMDVAFATWVPQQRSQVHRTRQQIIGERAARDRAALEPLPPTPYLVAERHPRPVGGSPPSPADLGGMRGTAGGAVGEGGGAVAADDLDAGPPGEPCREGVRPPGQTEHRSDDASRHR